MLTRLLLALSIIALTSIQALALDRVKATVTVTNAPTDGDVLYINGETRTWRTNVTAFGTEISISTNTLPYQATNLFEHVTIYNFSPFLATDMSETNEVVLVGQIGQSMTVTNSSGWGYVNYETQSVSSAYVVRVPASVEASANRYYIGDQLVNYIDTYATTNSFATNSPSLLNYMTLLTTQTVGGAKTFSGTNTVSGIFTGGTWTNQTIQMAADENTNGFGKIDFYDDSATIGNRLFADTNGYPMMVDAATGASLNYTPTDDHILTLGIADNVIPTLAGANEFTGTNEFAQITDSAITGGTISGATVTSSTLGGTLGSLHAGASNRVATINATGYLTNTSNLTWTDSTSNLFVRGQSNFRSAGGANSYLPLGANGAIYFTGDATLGSGNIIFRYWDGADNNVMIINAATEDVSFSGTISGAEWNGDVIDEAYIDPDVRQGLTPVSVTEADFSLSGSEYIYSAQANRAISITIDPGDTNTNVVSWASAASGSMAGVYVVSVGGSTVKVRMPGGDYAMTNGARRVYCVLGSGEVTIGSN